MTALFPHQPTLHVTLQGKAIFEEARVNKKYIYIKRSYNKRSEVIEEPTGLLTFCSVVKWGGLEASHEMEIGHSLLSLRIS
jgi:hypothetical protein